MQSDDNNTNTFPLNDKQVDSMMPEGEVSIPHESSAIIEKPFGGNTPAQAKEPASKAIRLHDEDNEAKIDKIRQELSLNQGQNEENPLRKERPESRPDRRFSVSQEQFSKDRLKALKETVDELKTDHPEVLSFMLFGSMAKGTAREESDIDGYLFVDADKVQYSDTTPLLEGGKNKNEYFNTEVNNAYADMLRKSVKEKAQLTDEQVSGMKVRPISNEIIDSQVEELVDRMNQWGEHEKSKQEREDNLNQHPEIPPSTIPYPEEPKLDSASLNLSGMFFLDVGGGIKPYRTYLIDKLSAMGEQGEKVWQKVVEGTESSEQKFQTNTDKKYPRTLQQARDTYVSSPNI